MEQIFLGTKRQGEQQNKCEYKVTKYIEYKNNRNGKLSLNKKLNFTKFSYFNDNIIMIGILNKIQF
jgi:hypothetical protein